MAHFAATGTIASDIVRKETRNGVLATFRLAAGHPGRGQLWIDVESWGHLAGTMYQHASRGQHVVVAGRLTQQTWHDRATGQERRKLVVTAHDVDLLHELHWAPSQANVVVASGVVDSTPATRPAGTGTVSEFVIRCGRAGSKTGRVWLCVEHWARSDQPAIAKRDAVAMKGRLAYRAPSHDEASTSPFYLAVTKLHSADPGRVSTS